MNTKRIARIILTSCLMSLSALVLSATIVKTQGNVNDDGDTYQYVVTMSRPSRAQKNGCWYARGGSNTYDIVNANVDAYANGTYPHDVRRLMVNTQKVLDGQRWVPTGDMQGAFDFSSEGIADNLEEGSQGMEQSKLKELHGDLYFYTGDWLGDVEEGTPYWHDARHTTTCLDDRFYADRYLIKACYTNEPLDTVKNDGEKLGKFLFAYKLIETTGAYDMAGGQMIAYIDNLDTRSSDMGFTASADVDADGRPNENVNVHFNWESTFMRDLLNRAGRYAGTNSGTRDGYSKDTDNPFMAHVHLNIWGDALTGTNERIPIKLENPDFCIRPLRPISVEFQTPSQMAAINGGSKDGEKVTITYTNMFRNQAGSPFSRVFPMDWRSYTQIYIQSSWIGFYQGFNDGKDNLWSTNTSQRSLSWNADNVVPDIVHILTNYGGKEVLLESRVSEVPIVMTHTYNDNGNIETTTFEYVSGGKAHEAFDILIPVTVKYVWGDITTTGEWMQTTDLPNTDEQYFHQSNMNHVRVHFSTNTPTD